MRNLHGTGVALVTPFDSSGEIDFTALERILTHTAQGVDYYVVLGTTGEASTLSHEERKKVLEFVKSHNPAKLPIVFGAGGNNTREIIETLHDISLDGVAAVLSVSPYYTKPSQEGIIQHFVAIADASPRPLILYNIPGRTSSNMTADTTLRLAQHRNIVGIKEASGNLEQCMRIAKHKPTDFMMISGDDMMAVALYGIGGVGVISVLANAFPSLFKRITSCAAAGAIEKANQELFKLLELNTPMYEEGNPVGVKELMAQMGLCSNQVRLPLVPASHALRGRIGELYGRLQK